MRHTAKANKSATLPEGLSLDLTYLGEALSKGNIPAALFDNVISGLNELPPHAIASADSKIAQLAQLHRRYDNESAMLKLFRPNRPLLDFLDSWPALAPLYIFHRDGFVREAALNHLKQPPASAFFLAAIACRLNDWIAPVRTAARLYAERVFPNTSPHLIVETAAVLLDRRQHWQRWDENNAAMIDKLFERPDVAALLFTKFALKTTGPLRSLLRYALRGPSLDKYLLPLSRNATQPAVRAIALKTLIRGRADWPVGFGHEWIDRRFNLSRRITLFAHREIASVPPLQALICQGLADRSAAVRRIAADALIENRATFPSIEDAVAALAADPSPTLRERAAFLAHKIAR
jgi:hypothetical protein